MGFKRKLCWLILVLMPLFLFTGCGDLEPDMQDTRTVILNMDFHGKSSSRSSSSVSASELSQYNTHLILALPSREYLTSSYKNFHSSFAQGLMNTADKKVSLEIPLNTQMKIFAFLFKENYSMSQLISGTREVGYYGESQSFSIGTNTNSLSLGITLIQVPDTGTDTGGGTDNTAPTASVTADTITTSGNAVVKSTETGTAYLVNTAITVSNLDSITGAADNQWNSVTISSADTDTNLPATGLADGTYKVYAIDAAGNISSASSNSVTVATTYNLPAPNNFSASGTSNTVTLSWNSVSGALSYTLYWNNVSGIDSSDNAITPISTDNYTQSNLDNGSTYYYKVAAVNSLGDVGSLSSEVSASTPLPAPDNFTASGTSNSVTLTWNAVSGASTYTLYWDNASGIDSSDTAITSITTDNYTHSGLENGTTYYYKVAAVDSTGTMGTLSSEVNASTPLPAPDNFSASGTSNTVTLSWNSVSGATSYTLYWDNVSGIDNSDTPITSITNDNYTHSSLDNGSIYYYKVAAVNSSGTGTLSSVASALLSSYVKDSASLSGHTFAITSAAMNWNNAKVQATALGGYLTTVNSKEENDWLTTRFRIQHGTLWIGANDIATNNTWVWDNGTTDNDNGLTDNICGSNSCPNSNATWADGSTRKWNSGEPNHSGASCGYIWKTSGRWDDVACSINKYAIIEFD